MIQIMRKGAVVPSRLSLARREAGLTQEESAEQAGLTRVTIARYETGHRAPSELALNMLATIYNKPVEWFFGEEEEPESTPEDPEEEDIDINDPSLSLFFRGEWDEFTEAEKEFVREAIRDARAYLKKRNEMKGRIDDRS